MSNRYKRLEVFKKRFKELDLDFDYEDMTDKSIKSYISFVIKDKDLKFKNSDFDC